MNLFLSLARLDGTSKPLRHTTTTMEDFLQLDEWTEKKSDPKKKSVSIVYAFVNFSNKFQLHNYLTINYITGSLGRY